MQNIKMFSIHIHEEMQVQTPWKLYLTLIGMAMVQKRNNKCWHECGGKGNIYLLLGRVQNGAAAVELSMEDPQKARNISFIWSSSITLRQILKGLYISLWIYLLIHVHHCSIHICSEMELALLSISWWIHRNHVHLCNGVLFSCCEKINLWNLQDGVVNNHSKWH